MKFVTRSLLTIVAESALETRLISELTELGIPGYTVTASHGAGVRGEREGDIQGGNIRIETVLNQSTAEQVLAHLESRYFAHYACVAWIQEVKVLREDRFS